MELLLLVVVFAFLSSVQSGDSSVLVSVSRRQSTDVYYYNDSTHGTICDNDNHIDVTYLVSERRCIANEDLFSGN